MGWVSMHCHARARTSISRGVKETSLELEGAMVGNVDINVDIAAL